MARSDRRHRRLDLGAGSLSARSLLPDLPRRAWILLAGDCVSFFGNGLVMPFTIVYLTRARGISIEVAAFSLSFRAIIGLAAGPIAGALVDRVGARKVLMAAQFAAAVGMVLYVLVREPWHAFVAAGMTGIGFSIFWPSMQSMLSVAVDADKRSAMFSVHYASLNFGIGIGGIVGGFVADIGNAASFERLYLLDALTFLPLMFMLVFVPVLAKLGDPPPDDERGAELGPGGYLEVFKDRVFVRVMVLMMVLVTVGYSQLESSFPAFATGTGGIGTVGLGLAFAGNTFFIVVAQLVVLKRLEGHRRTNAVAVLCAAWGLCWLVTIGAGALTGGIATVGFVLAMVVFAFGETLLAPTIPAIINDLAPERLRGRYNAMYSLSWNGGSIIGPALAGLFLGAGLAVIFFVGLIAACGFAGLMALSLARHLPKEANLMTKVSAA